MEYTLLDQARQWVIDHGIDKEFTTDMMPLQLRQRANELSKKGELSTVRQVEVKGAKGGLKAWVYIATQTLKIPRPIGSKSEYVPVRAKLLESAINDWKMARPDLFAIPELKGKSHIYRRSM